MNMLAFAWWHGQKALRLLKKTLPSSELIRVGRRSRYTCVQRTDGGIIRQNIRMNGDGFLQYRQSFRRSSSCPIREVTPGQSLDLLMYSSIASQLAANPKLTSGIS